MSTRGWLFAALLASAPLHAQQQSAMPSPQIQPGTGAIAGHVAAADTGQPIRGASITVSVAEFSGGPAKRAVTDADGRYQVTGLGAGHYRVTASADHYLSMQFGQLEPGPTGLNNPTRTIDLHDGERFDTADFKLSHMSAIEGTVVDEFGDPVPNVSIQVSQVQFGGGKRRLMPASISGGSGPAPPTDDKGHFRMFGLAPGEYYVSALSGAFADPNAAGGFGVTFYPGVASASAAKPVVLPPGRDVTGLQFALVPAAMARVTGTVVDGDGKPISRSNLMLMPNERTGTSAFMMVRALAGDDGTFSFRNVPPGAYTIQAYGAPVGNANNLGAFAFGYLTLDVDGKDLDGVRVRVPAPRSIRGKITFEGGSTPPAPDDVRVTALPVEFESAPIGGGPPPTKTNDDWTFEVSAMSGVRAVQVSAPGGWFLQRIVRAGVDISDTPLDLREKDASDIELVLTTRPAIVTGSVSLADGTPVTECSVVIFGADETKWGPWSRWVTLARPNQQGAFNVKGLPAGSYFAVALASLPSGAWEDPETLKALRDAATRFSLLDSGTYTLQLKLKRE
jgi:protocatechuate 3,4-dioxygenase beta subunit